ncbi:hypothetical protein LSH36_279g03129 [Paralvinella palmiformis]|uniref:EXPERA domain-containing protein n=1 Tax=Paralvinella palmiformis TaxID=53620 RepID=A0AAD9JIW3_9ANNE|nr:hypothetical protein LSH36_279g03129 [Paralvinella palmiformis]
MTVLMLGTFSSVADFLIGLETDGLLSGFMTKYLSDGEPYLQTPHGSMICYWDGIAHYVMYILMLYALSWGRSYREVGLYWAGSIGHSMIVFIPGNVVGKFGLRTSFLLNIPYMFLPYWSMAKFLRERPTLCVQQKKTRCIWCRPLDLLLVFCLIAAFGVAFVRGFAALDAQDDLFKIYRVEYEPYLSDPVSYPKIQMLVYMFYYVPYYVLAIYGLVYQGNVWMPDWSLIHAGAAVQAQVSHIGASLHSGTDPQLRVPDDTIIRSSFWLINVVLLLIVPQLLALRCNVNKSFFVRPVNHDEKPVTKSAMLKKNE